MHRDKTIRFVVNAFNPNLALLMCTHQDYNCVNFSNFALNILNVLCLLSSRTVEESVFFARDAAKSPLCISQRKRR